MISVLYVDDEPGLLEVTQFFLERTGDFRVAISVSAKESLESSAIHSCDIIISDYQMPGMDGIEFLKVVRERFGDMPFILFTGRGREEVVIEAVNNGADFYLQKGGDPIAQFTELAHKIRQAVRRREAERELRRSEERYRSVVNDQTEMIVRFAPDGRITFSNEAYRAYFMPMLALDAIEGKNIHELMQVANHEEIRDFLSSLTPETPIREMERTVTGSDNTTYSQHWSVRALFDGSGRPSEYQVVGRDITEQKRSLLALAESESRLRSFIETTRESVAIIDEEGRVLEWNPASEQISGIGTEDAVGRTLWDLTFSMLPPGKRTEERRAVLEKAMRTMLATGIPPFPEPRVVEAVRPDGTRIFTRQTIFPIRTARGFRFGSFSQDITREKLAEEARYDSEERFRSFVETSPDIIWEIDRQGILRYVSPMVREVLGYSPEEITGTPITGLVAEGEKQHVMEELARRVASEVRPSPMEVVVRHRNGTSRILEIRPSPTGTGGKVGRFRGVAVDITERKQTEKALFQMNKKLSLLSSITRHDINNKMMTLNGFIAIVRKNINDPSFDHFFSRIAEISNQISSIIRFTREYEQLGLFSPIWQNVGKTARIAAVDLLPENIRLAIHTGDCEVFADPMLMFALYNLFDNSKRHGGQVTEITVRFTGNGETGTLIIEDNGRGIPAQNKEQIFERGFGKNTGLGLFLIREILAITGLAIREAGEEGKGARFEILLPPGTWRNVTP